LANWSFTVAINPTATLTFDDEFNTLSLWNGLYGSSAAGTWLTYWQPQGGILKPTELQWYINSNYAPTSSVQPWTVNNGILSLTAAPAPLAIQPYINNYQYTSGFIDSAMSFTQTYGYFETRAELPAGQGLHPAFWLLNVPGAPYAEIDVVETIGSQPTQISGAVWNSTSTTGIGNWATVPDTSKAFHTYGVDWEPDYITWYFDGKEIGRTATPSDMNHPMMIVANLAVGGVGSWPGPPDASTPFPASMQIDYIHAYSSDPNAPAAPVITSFSPNSNVVNGVTNATQLTLIGTAEVNCTVVVFDGTTTLGTTTSDASGAWSFTTGTLVNGAHSFTAADFYAASDTSAASSALAVTVDTVAPVVSSVVASGSGITNGTGDLNAGHVVTLTVQLSEAVTVAGGTLTLNDGGTATYTSGSGTNALTFSYTVAAGQNTTDLAVTAVNLNAATVTDAAGNAAVLTAAVTTLAGMLQIDTTAPTAPVISSDSPANGTAVNAVTLTGTAEANSLVTVYKGTSELGTVTANSTGAWSYTTGTLAAGTYTFTATATDAAGNVSAMSQPIDPTIGSNTYPTNNTSLTITDTNDTVILSGNNDTVNLTGGNDAIQLSGSNDQLKITGSGNSVNVTGLNDSVSATGTVTVTFSGSGTVAATIGSGSTLNLADNLTGSGNDTLALTGNGGTVNLNQLAHFSGFSGVSLSGSNDTLTLTNANLTVTRLSGSGDTIKLGTGIDAIAYSNVNQSTHSSPDTIIGFNIRQDKIDFSAVSGLNSNIQHVTINHLTSTPNNVAGHTIDVVTSRGSTVVYANATGSNESISANHEDMQINLTGVSAPNSSDFILHH
jgi:beta-glucanase (GH16 family)